MYEFRREGPRIDVEAMCWELVDRHEVSGLAVDLSTMGVRIERPYVGGHTRNQVPLQIEVPGIDEIMWARGDAVFDVVVPAPKAGPMGLMRRTGYHLKLAASRDLRLLKEFVWETHRLRALELPARSPGEADGIELAPWSAPARAFV